MDVKDRTGLVSAFTAAEEEYRTDTARWNALTPQERTQCAREAGSRDGGGLAALSDAVTEAARRLIEAAAEDHHIEEQAVVYLRMGAHGWVIDSPTFDGYPLTGYDDGALNEACDQHDPSADEQPATDTATDQADNIQADNVQAGTDQAGRELVERLMEQECEALRRAADHVATPTAQELAVLLVAEAVVTEALGGDR